VVIAREESDNSVGVPLEDCQYRRGDCDACSEVFRLRDDGCLPQVAKLPRIKRFVFPRNYRERSITVEKGADAAPCLAQQTLTPENSTELLRT
jgi:hypothetical protein